MHFTHVLCKMGTNLSLVMNITEVISSFYVTKHRRSVTLHILYESVQKYTRVSLAFLIFTEKRRTREMVVGVVRTTDESCSIHSEQRRFLFFPKRSDRPCRPASLLFIDFRGLLLRVEWLGREPDDSLPHGAVSPLPPYAFMACTGMNLLRERTA